MLDIKMLAVTLKLIRELQKFNHPLSGVLIRIENVGHSFYWGARLEDMEKSSIFFQQNDLAYPFVVIGTMIKIPAQVLMKVIHALNDAYNLPGLLKYLEQYQEAA